MKNFIIILIAFISLSAYAMEIDSVALVRQLAPDSVNVYEDSVTLNSTSVTAYDPVNEDTTSVESVEALATTTDKVDSTMVQKCDVDNINLLIDKVNQNRALLKDLKLKDSQLSAVESLLYSYDELVQALIQREENNQRQFASEKEKTAWFLGFLSDDESVFDITVPEGQTVPLVLEQFYDYLSKVREVEENMDAASAVLKRTIDFVKSNGVTDDSELKDKVIFNLKNSAFTEHLTNAYEGIIELKSLEQPLSAKQQAYFQRIRDRFNNELFPYIEQ